jgi:Homeodomain-like domain
MDRPRYTVRLTACERQELEAIVKKGKGGAHRIRNAQILLHSDVSVCGVGEKPRSVEEIASMLHCHKDTVCEARKRLVERGFEACLDRKPQARPSIERLFDGEAEARLIALACSSAPEGRTRWTLQLLSDKVVELKVVPHCTANTVHEILKKTNLSLI